MTTQNNDKVIATKTALMSSLGDTSTKYLLNLKMWFRQKFTKEEFDQESRKLLTTEQIHLHNKFFLSILNKIESLTPTVVSSIDLPSAGMLNKRKRKRHVKPLEKVSFKEASIFNYMRVEDIPESASADTTQQQAPRYAAQELFLPDTGLILGRLLIGAWELGLTNADESAAELMATAVQVLLKNILSEILLKRRHFRVTDNGSYFYDVGFPIKDPYLRNTVARQKIDDSPLEIDKAITTLSMPRQINEDTLFVATCEEVYSKPKRKISSLDVYKTLLDKNVIKNHSVFSMNIERISNMLQ